ncbi:adenine deaminase [bacterium BMS3Abin02]|nr:adenine deaminase [bacterium BMS3Abin02]GBE21209.1 adenine deaminase [bacterium BMS3Bbin01]
MLEDFIRELPKAELHIHIEGSLEPEMMMALAERNDISIPFSSVKEIRDAYEFRDLQSFLDIYYDGASVLRTEQDFYDLAWAYLERAVSDGVKRAEIFFDPQTHTSRGIAFSTVVSGLRRAVDDARDLGVSAALIMSFLRHLSPEEAMQTLDDGLRFRSSLIGVGLDSSERGRPPELFAKVFARARSEGLHLVAHAGEEGPPEYIRQALDVLGVERIDHGVRIDEDPELVRRIISEQIPLTMCPLSNVKLRVVDELEHHNLKRLLDAGAMVTINSDDPAYFGGYIADNYEAAAAALGLTRTEIVTIARNSIDAAFISPAEHENLLADLDVSQLTR